MIIELFNRDKSVRYKPVIKYGNLNFETDADGGFIQASWIDKRNAGRSYDGLKPFNQVAITDNEEIAWEGYLDEPKHTGMGLSITALGWISILNTMGLQTNQPSQKCSTFINNIVLGNASVNKFLSAGTITTVGDYVCPAFDDIRPWKYYSEVLSDYNKWNDWSINILEGRRLNYTPRQTHIKWVVRASDCKGFEIAQSPGNYWNAVAYSYSEDGNNIKIGTVQSTASQNLWEREVWTYLDIPGICTPAQALHMANILLTSGLTMTVTGDLDTNKVYEFPSYNLVKNLWRVKGGDVVLVVEFLPGDAGITDVANEITSFGIKATSYNVKSKRIVISPKERSTGLDTTLTRLESKTKNL